MTDKATEGVLAAAARILAKRYPGTVWTPAPDENDRLGIDPAPDSPVRDAFNQTTKKEAA